MTASLIEQIFWVYLVLIVVNICNFDDTLQDPLFFIEVHFAIGNQYSCQSYIETLRAWSSRASVQTGGAPRREQYKGRG